MLQLVINEVKLILPFCQIEGFKQYKHLAILCSFIIVTTLQHQSVSSSFWMIYSLLSCGQHGPCDKFILFCVQCSHDITWYFCQEIPINTQKFHQNFQHLPREKYSKRVEVLGTPDRLSYFSLR